MSRAYFGPSPTRIHVEAGSGSEQDKHHRSRTKSNSLRPVEEERGTAWQERCNGKVRRKREKKQDRDAGTKSKCGIAGIPQGNRRNPALVPYTGNTTKRMPMLGSRPALDG